MNELEILIGQTMTSVVNRNNNDITFTSTTGKQYMLFHSQDCCENVWIEDIIGDLEDLVGSPILVAEERSVKNNDEKYLILQDNPDPSASITWTFYRFATIKGTVSIRWMGSSNGYYSESVDFEEVEKNYEKEIKI